MTSNTGYIVPIVLLLLGLTLVGCEQEQQAVEVERQTSVNVSIVGTSDEEVTRSFTGSIEGERQADLYAKISEAVEKVHFSEGKIVRAGQVVVSLDKDGPSSNFRQAQSLLNNSKKHFEKMELLYNEGAVSETQFDAARTDYEVNQAAFDAAAQLVRIESPVNGIVTSVDVSPGDFVGAGQKLATVASIDKLRIKLAVNARDIDYFLQGAKVTVNAEGVDETGVGEVVSIARSADPETRAFQVEVGMDNASEAFSPGLFVAVGITLEELDDVIVVDRGAVLLLDNQNVAFVVYNGTADKRTLTLGADLNGHVVVREGLSTGDTLVTLGQTYLDDGFKVKIIEVES